MKTCLLLTALTLLCLSTFVSCNSLTLHKAAGRAGITNDLQGPAAVAGTFSNISVKKFGPGYIKLWDLLKESQTPWKLADSRSGASSFAHHVRISEAGPGLLDVTLLSNGSPRQTVRMPYTHRGRYLHLRHHSNFDWMPLGYSHGSSDLALTATKHADLILLYRYQVSGVIAFGSAGDSGVLEFRFPRITTSTRTP